MKQLNFCVHLNYEKSFHIASIWKCYFRIVLSYRIRDLCSVPCYKETCFHDMRCKSNHLRDKWFPLEMKFLRGSVTSIISGPPLSLCWFEGRGGGLFSCKWFWKFLFYKWSEKTLLSIKWSSQFMVRKNIWSL